MVWTVPCWFPAGRRVAAPRVRDHPRAADGENSLRAFDFPIFLQLLGFGFVYAGQVLAEENAFGVFDLTPQRPKCHPQSPPFPKKI
jgi:hypothetical protein